ncbi:MAG: TetR/AcrR family transcriptional regulator [Spirochaetes bacterium]|nr:TetR/AcrR family transcriptional regulator [Spirochaetota bacterium]
MNSEVQQENKKYLDLLNTGRNLVFKYGIKRVTVEEICEKSNVSKVTFYKYFHNKDELVMKILEDWVDQGIKEFLEIRDETIPFMEKIAKFIQLNLSLTHNYSHEFIEEIMGSNENLKHFFDQASRKSLELVMDFFSEAQKEGLFRKSVPPEFYIYLIEHFGQMMNDEKLKTMIPNPHERYQELINFFFFGFNECDKTMEA